MTPTQLIGMGFSIFPCRDKRPLTRHGVKDATTGRLLVQRWAELYPDCQWAVACGEASGIVVVDVDKVEGEPVYRTVRRLYQRGLYCKNRVATPSGGLHYYFQWQPGLTNKVRIGGEPIDLRTDGGYVIFPVDSHPVLLSTGYRVLEWFGAPYDVLPSWVAKACERPVINTETTGDKLKNRPDLPAEKMLASVKGKRNHDLFSLACWAIREGGSLEKLCEAAASMGLTEFEINRTVDSARRNCGGQE